MSKKPSVGLVPAVGRDQVARPGPVRAGSGTQDPLSSGSWATDGFLLIFCKKFTK